MRTYLAIAVWLVAPLNAAADPRPCTPLSGRSIIVSGSSTVQLSPDRVSLTVGVETFAPVAGEAFNANSLKAQAVITALKAKGVADKEIQTSKTVGEVVCVSDSPTWQFGVSVSGGVVGGIDSAVENGVQELHYAVYAVFELK